MIGWVLKLIVLALLILIAILGHLKVPMLTKLEGNQGPENQQKCLSGAAVPPFSGGEGVLDRESMPKPTYLIVNKEDKLTHGKRVSRYLPSLKNIQKANLLKIKRLTNGKKLV
ncbi:MAG: hypothetical protein QME69_02785 [Candidatus Saccharicenans sp.]|nr:hypothetical protein [Candidatus Saccharicenans sp.]